MAPGEGSGVSSIGTARSALPTVSQTPASAPEFRMPAIVVIGGQWGDEGKGRVVDFHSQYCS
ncbi:MAG: adenylosuccinate synthetase, partial [Dehalococcoidia bacterium]